MAEQIEIAEAVEAVAREIYVQGVTNYDGVNRDDAEKRWDSGHIPARNKFYYRETAMKLVLPAFEPIARQVWGFTQPDEDYPGFEVTRG